MPYIILFLSLILYGVATTLQKSALKGLGLRSLLRIHGWTACGLYLFIWYFFSKDLTLSHYLFPFLGAFASAIGFVFFYEALKRTSASLVSVITGTYAIFTVLCSICFLKEVFLINYGLGFLLIMIGMIFVSGNRIKKPSFFGIILSVCASLLWGLWGFFSKISYNYVGEPEILGALGVTLLLVFLLYTSRMPDDRKYYTQKGEIIGFISIIITCFASICCYFSLQFFPASFAMPIISAYPLVTIITSYFILKESLTKKQLFASFLIIIGIILFFL